MCNLTMKEQMDALKLQQQALRKQIADLEKEVEKGNQFQNAMYEKQMRDRYESHLNRQADLLPEALDAAQLMLEQTMDDIEDMFYRNGIDIRHTGITIASSSFKSIAINAYPDIDFTTYKQLCEKQELHHI